MPAHIPVPTVSKRDQAPRPAAIPAPSMGSFDMEGELASLENETKVTSLFVAVLEQVSFALHCYTVAVHSAAAPPRGTAAVILSLANCGEVHALKARIETQEQTRGQIQHTTMLYLGTC